MQSHRPEKQLADHDGIDGAAFEDRAVHPHRGADGEQDHQQFQAGQTQAVAGFVDLAMSHPGNGALLMAAILSPDQGIRIALDRTTPHIWSMFGAGHADPRAELDATLLPADVLERRVRVVSALGGITSVVAATQAAALPGLRSLLLSIAARTLEG